jgi:hypothetical protein
MRQLATIQRVADVQPIENADQIEKIKVLDWWCVSKKGEFAVGDPCVYFEIDSLLPSSHSAFSFLAKGSREVTVSPGGGATVSGYRLKTVRLRGQISQGLALPAASFALNGAVGDNVSELLGIHKWDPPISKRMAAIAIGPFPSFIPKPDEERVQNLGDSLTAVPSRSIAQKNASVCAAETWICSVGIFTGTLRTSSISNPNFPSDLPCRAKLSVNRSRVTHFSARGTTLYIFSVYDIPHGRYLDPAETHQFVADRGLNTVPLVQVAPLPKSVAEIVSMADGKSLLNPNVLREGLVFRPQRLRAGT